MLHKQKLKNHARFSVKLAPKCIHHLSKILAWSSNINVHIILYGIGRASPQHVNRSLKNLKAYWPKLTSFETTHVLLQIDTIDNPRSGEKYNQQRLEPFGENVDKLIIKTPDELEAASTVNRSILNNYRDIYEDNGKSLDNLFNQLLLLEYAGSTLIDNEVNKTFVFCRDDIMVYHSPIFNLSGLTRRNLIIPGFHWHRGYNDRFMLGSHITAGIWAHRIRGLETLYSEKRELSGETLLKYTINQNNINVLAFPRVFPRIRNNCNEVTERNPLSLNRPREFLNILIAYFKFFIWRFRS